MVRSSRNNVVANQLLVNEQGVHIQNDKFYYFCNFIFQNSEQIHRNLHAT
jgi:hypothetical protein